MATTTDVGRPNRDIRRLSEKLEALPLEVVEDITFEGRDIYLDGRVWRRCIFRNCRLWVYFGRWKFEESVVHHSQWTYYGSSAEVKRSVEKLLGKQIPSQPPNTD